MIYLITGVPGSGKTLKAVSMIHEWLGEGRRVYSDIEGLNIPAVQPAPDDWTTTPEGSVVVYDECQRIFPSTGKAGVAEDPRIRAMETHRHTGHDLVFITQAPTFVHHHIRKLVGKHIHVFRALGLKGATLYTWDGICDTPNDKREHRRADVTRWSYPPKLFQDYKSATVHTHNFKMPKKFIFLGIALLAIIALVVIIGKDSSIYQALTDDTAQGETQTKTQTSQPLTPTQSPPAGEGGGYQNPLLQDIADTRPVSKSILGCAMGNHCRVWGSDGEILDLSDAQCRNVCTGSISMPITIPVSQGKEKGV
jgi:zona occludens toxin (predicted ATPase)